MTRKILLFKHVGVDNVRLFLLQNFNSHRMDNLYSGYETGLSKFKSPENKALLENEQFESIVDNHFF